MKLKEKYTTLLDKEPTEDKKPKKKKTDIQLK